ncbi:MAG: alpha/beta fold hydrolase [Gammaproteobacteria bacterium]|nr:alpha/beta fold hydrolase [Gammaproteobacteria bacterium]MCW5583325.1 alpha/beta fold hydrolase [Gammaproteobacteria bacterium]
MKAKIRNTEIYFDIAGMQLQPSGNDFIERPVMFILHGGPGGDHLRFKQHSIELQEVVQLVFIDHRGCGRSKKTKPADYTMKNNIEDIEALRNHLGLEKICILGTSYGGMVAQGYAAKYHRHLEKLILVATAPSYRFLNEARQYLQQYGSSKQNSISQHLWNGTFKNHKHVVDFFKAMDAVYSTTAKKNRKKLFSQSRTIWSHEALNKGFSSFLRNFDIIPKLKNITCPTLILAGENDWICSPNQSKTIAKHILKSQLKIFKKCGHSIAVDAHDQYIRAVKRFLKK